MAIKFNVYYKTDLSEPWVLANQTPITFDPAGNEYTLEDLQPDTRYYLAIVPGLEENGEFTPYLNQAIGPTSNAVTDINSANVPTIQAKTRVNASLNATLGNTFTVV